MIGRGNARVDFYGVLTARVQDESVGDGVRESFDLLRIEIRRSSAAPVHLSDETSMSFSGEVHFPRQLIDVGCGHSMMFFHNDVASAVEAKTLAERNMDIDGKRDTGSS